MTSERGSLSIVVVTGALVLCLFALGAADLGAMLNARARAQAAADAAALAAAVEQVPVFAHGEEPAHAARAEAEANGATLLRCECAYGTAEATVEVSVEVKLGFVAGWFGRPAHAVARAAVDPDVLSYRDDG